MTSPESSAAAVRLREVIGLPEADIDLAEAALLIAKNAGQDLEVAHYLSRIDQLAAQLGLSVTWDPAIEAVEPNVRDALISCEVRDANVDHLLQAILAPAGLAAERDGLSLTLRAQ